MNNLALWSAVVAFCLPPVLSVLIQSKWTARVKAMVFFGVCLIAAAGTAYFQGDLTGRRWLDAALIIVAGAAAFYHGFWKPSTSPRRSRRSTNLVER